jgi:hypothetical protein
MGENYTGTLGLDEVRCFPEVMGKDKRPIKAVSPMHPKAARTWPAILGQIC